MADIPVPLDGRVPLVRRGSQGSFVKRLQALLNALRNAGLAEDGDFGPATEGAVRNFQTSAHIVVDGIVGSQTWGALVTLNEPLAQITVRQPLPFDLVGGVAGVAGIGTAFEATISLRAYDANGNQVAAGFLNGGGNGVLNQFAGFFDLRATPPATTQGTIEAFEQSAKDGSKLHLVTVPVVYGTAIDPTYYGFVQHVVVAGDTLSALAQRYYGDASKFPRIAQANPHLIADPNLIFAGQVFRIPVGSDFRF